MIDWGDGTATTAATITPTATPGFFTIDATHIYGDAITHTATVTVTDLNGGSSASQTFQVVVNDVAPTLTTQPPDVIVAQGATLSLPSIGFTDPTFAEPNPSYTPSFTYTIDWGDGTPASTGTANIDQSGSAGVLTIGDFTGSHVYTAPNTYTVTISINDNEGQTTSETFTVQVVVPVIQTIPTQTVNEGSTLTLSGATFSDPDPNGSYTAVIDWGDGTATTAATITPTATPGFFTIDATHIYGDAITHTATVTVTDLNGGSSASQTFQVVVNDVAPTSTTQPPDVIVAQGATLSLPSIGFTDPTFAEPNPSYTPSFTYTIDWGDGTPASTGTANIDQSGSAGVLTIGDFTGSHVYTAPNTYTVTISINDNEGQTTSETFTVQVVVPVIQTIPTQTVNEGSTLTLTGATFSDPDPIGSYTAVIDWGDGTATTAATITPTATPGVFTIDATHIYGNAITHTATITVTDLNGGSFATRTFQVVVKDWSAPTITTSAVQRIAERRLDVGDRHDCVHRPDVCRSQSQVRSQFHLHDQLGRRHDFVGPDFGCVHPTGFGRSAYAGHTGDVAFVRRGGRLRRHDHDHRRTRRFRGAAVSSHGAGRAAHAQRGPIHGTGYPVGDQQYGPDIRSGHQSADGHSHLGGQADQRLHGGRCRDRQFVVCAHVSGSARPTQSRGVDSGLRDGQREGWRLGHAEFSGAGARDRQHHRDVPAGAHPAAATHAANGAHRAIELQRHAGAADCGHDRSGCQPWRDGRRRRGSNRDADRVSHRQGKRQRVASRQRAG